MMNDERYSTFRDEAIYAEVGEILSMNELYDKICEEEGER